MAPPSFDDLGKAARDLFNKGYNHGFLKFDSTTVTGNKSNVQFKTGAAHSLTSQKLAGNLEVQYKDPEHGFTVTEKWNTDNVIGSVFEVNDQFARGLKVTLDTSFNVASSKRVFLLKSEWANELFKVNANINLQGGPKVTLSGVANHQDWLVGAQTKFEASRNEVKNVSAAFGRVTPEYAFHSYTHDGREFGASIYHKVHRNLELGTQLGWTTEEQNPRFGVATKYNISKDLALRAKVDNKSNVAVAATHDLNNGLKLTLTSTFTLVGAETANNKFGLGLEYNA
jgi:hypothetical protein